MILTIPLPEPSFQDLAPHRGGTRARRARRARGDRSGGRQRRPHLLRLLRIGQRRDGAAAPRRSRCWRGLRWADPCSILRRAFTKPHLLSGADAQLVKRLSGITRHLEHRRRHLNRQRLPARGLVFILDTAMLAPAWLLLLRFAPLSYDRTGEGVATSVRSSSTAYGTSPARPPAALRHLQADAWTGESRRVPLSARPWRLRDHRHSGVPLPSRIERRSHAGKKLFSRIATHQPLSHLGQAFRIRDSGFGSGHPSVRKHILSPRKNRGAPILACTCVQPELRHPISQAQCASPSTPASC